jgi:hypothetical protein
MKLRNLFSGACALLLLLPLQVAAEYINVYPGPLLDENGEPIINPDTGNWVYLYDYGDVEVGSSADMIFQIENDATASDDLILDNVTIEGTGDFTITEPPLSPVVPPGTSVYVEVTFAPSAEGLIEGVMRILSNASNIPPGPNIPYALQGTGVGVAPEPEDLIAAAIAFYDEQIAAGQIIGLGPGRSGNAQEQLFRNTLTDIEALILEGDDQAACRSLQKAILRIDGASPPPDKVGGPAVSELHSMLLYLMNALGC